MLIKDIHDSPHEDNPFIKTQITKCNNKHMKDEYGDAYDKFINAGKYHYVFNVGVRVRDETSDGRVVYHNEHEGPNLKMIRKKKTFQKVEFMT